MGALILGLAAAGAITAASPAGDPVARWRPHVEEAARRFALPPAWIEGVIRAESGGKTTLHGRPLRSSAGAMGLMQLMPATWRTMRAHLRLGPNPDDPRDNILAGSLYLRMMQDRFGYPGLFGAYNLGPSGYARYLAGQRSLPGETRAYLAKLSGESAPPMAPSIPAPRETLFVAGAKAGYAIEAPAVHLSLFVVRSDAD